MGETFWEPLAELYVILDGLPVSGQKENQEVFCLCSRAIICNPVHQPLERTEYENGSVEESSSDELEDKVLLDNVSKLTSYSTTKYKLKGDSEEPGSCYGSASTDEPDSLFGVRNSSDSGADVAETLESEQAALWEQHWAVHGPQIVWKSWGKKYADYMDPTAGVNFADPYPGDTVPVDIESAGPAAEQGTDVLPPSHDAVDRVEDGMKSLGIVIETDRSSPLSVVSSDFDQGQTASSTTWSEDSMTDVTRLSATSADLGLTSDSREDENAAAWQAEWDRHCAEQYAAEYLKFARKQTGNDLGDNQASLESQEIFEESQEILKEASEILEKSEEVPAEAQKVPWQEEEVVVEAQDVSEQSLDNGCPFECGSNVTEIPATIDELVTPCSGDKNEVSAQAEAGDVKENGKQITTNKRNSSRHRFRGLSVEGSVGYLLRSLAHQSQPSDADGSGDNKGEGQGDVASETAAGNAGSGANTASSANYSASNGKLAGSGDEPPEQRPDRPMKRPHEEDADGNDEKQSNDNVGRALSLLGLNVAAPPFVGYAHFSKRPAAIRAQNRRLRFGNKQPWTSGNNDNAESSDDELPDELPSREPIAEQEYYRLPGIDETPSDVNQSGTTAETDLVDMVEDPRDSLADMAAEVMEMHQDPPESAIEVAGASADMDDEPFVIKHASENTTGPLVCVQRPSEQQFKRKRNQNKQRKRGVPHEVRANPLLRKFWNRRFQLFSRFNEGIRLDEESWYSVTPEAVAIHLAHRCKCDLIVDAFCGAGGNAIQFAFTCQRVIAIDIDPVKLSLARHNAEVYGVADRIEFVLGDFTRLAPYLGGDVVFLSPPWGGMGYMAEETYSLERVLPPLGGEELFRLARMVSENIAYYLPRNTDTRQVISLGGHDSFCEIEQSFLDRQHVAITAYYGELMQE